MALTLSTNPGSKLRERTIVSACLQARAPLSYEIRDADDRRLAPTLAGYKLRRGGTYCLKVRTQDKAVQGWSLRVLVSRSTADPAGPDEIAGDARAITFHTTPPSPGELWKWFGSSVTFLPVRLDFEDGREPYRFDIPIILLASRSRWILSLFLTALASAAAGAVFRERLTIPSLAQLGYLAGIWAAVIIACVCWDQWKFYRRALSLIAAQKGGGELMAKSKLAAEV